MKPLRIDDGRGFRTTLVVALLVASLILVAILAWQAVEAARSHRTATESVLRDFAGLAAGEFVRRSTAEVGFAGYYPVIGALRLATASAPSGSLPTQQEIASRFDDRARPALSLARLFFRFDPGSDRLVGTGTLSQPVKDRLLPELRGLAGSADQDDRAFRVIHVSVEGDSHSFVIAPIVEATPSPRSLVGFEVALGALEAWFQRVFDHSPLLPESLGRGRLDNTFLRVIVRDAAGREVFRAGRADESEFAAEVPYGTAYQGMFEGMKARVSIDPISAPRLVIGGLPYSRIPFLVGLLLLTVGFVAAGIFQLHRERSLAALRSEFVSRVSHELRTPLTQIRMFAETLLLDRVRTDEERRRSLEIIDREARRLGHLVQNILQFSRGERGALRVEPSPHELGPLIRDALESFQPLARRKGVVLESRLPDGLAALVDEDALRQILLNLLDNAVQYGPEGQTVRVGGSGTGTVCRIWVDDGGPGVPPEERERIWAPFQRLARDQVAARAGTGIGLSVVRDLTALHGGRCWVEEGPTGGARFVVELPGAPMPPTPPPVTPPAGKSSPAAPAASGPFGGDQ